MCLSVIVWYQCEMLQNTRFSFQSIENFAYFPCVFSRIFTQSCSSTAHLAYRLLSRRMQGAHARRKPNSSQLLYNNCLITSVRLCYAWHITCESLIRSLFLFLFLSPRPHNRFGRLHLCFHLIFHFPEEITCFVSQLLLDKLSHTRGHGSLFFCDFIFFSFCFKFFFTNIVCILRWMFDALSSHGKRCSRAKITIAVKEFQPANTTLAKYIPSSWCTRVYLPTFSQIVRNRVLSENL